MAPCWLAWEWPFDEPTDPPATRLDVAPPPCAFPHCINSAYICLYIYWKALLKHAHAVCMANARVRAAYSDETEYFRRSKIALDCCRRYILSSHAVYWCAYKCICKILPLLFLFISYLVLFYYHLVVFAFLFHAGYRPLSARQRCNVITWRLCVACVYY